MIAPSSHQANAFELSARRIGLAAGIGLGLLALGAWRRSRFSLRGKTVAISGGSRGLGLELAREFCRQGAQVAICARDSQEVAVAQQALKNECRAVLGEVCDVTSRSQVEKFVRSVVRRFGGIDVLVNNAGIIQAGPMEAMTEEDFEQAMRVHFWGPLYLTLAALPFLRKRDAARIVNIASIGGKIAVPHLLPYCASKFALVGLSEGLRAELEKDRIAVTTVCPGLMRTGSPRHAQFKGQHREEYAWFSIADSLPLLSISSQRAASQIVDACRQGKAEVVLSLPAQLATVVQSLLPGATALLAAWANRLLPAYGGIGRASRPGYASQSRWSPSWLTYLTERAAARNHENIDTDGDGR